MRGTVITLCLKGTALVVLMATVSTAAMGAIQSDNNERLQSYLATAQQAAARKDFSAAADSYRSAIQLSPQIAELRADLGLMCHEAGDFDGAIKSFIEAARLNPSLYVPQLFLGIDNLELKHTEAAIPYLEKAEKLNPRDPQAPIMLGRAFAIAGNGNSASDAYSRAVVLAPENGTAWLGLGMAYLQQVDSDARSMTSTYKNSSYTKLRAGELFAEQGKLVQAADAYKTELSVASPPPCSHAGYGIVLLRQKAIPEAKAELDREASSKSGCPLTELGYVALHLVQGYTENALKELVTIWNADEGFLEDSLPLLSGGITAEQTQKLLAVANDWQVSNRVPAGLVDAIREGLASDAPAIASLHNFSGDLSAPERKVAIPENPEKLYLSGQFGKCGESLQPRLSLLTDRSLLILAPCAFYTGDDRTAAMAARKLAANPTTRPIGLYWESRADQKLAIAALTRAGEIDADSPRMHVLLGDVYRRKRRWEDSAAEYRKALALEPENRSGRLGLAISVFQNGNSEEAFAINKELLQKDPDDREANMLAAEIFVQQHRYVDAEAYLNRCRGIQPELMPRIHALLGEVYANTSRDQEALAEFKLVSTSDTDGSVHYQMGRIYQKLGDKKAAAEAFQASKLSREQWDESANVAVEQSATDISRH